MTKKKYKEEVQKREHYLDDLPNETKNQVRGSGHDVLGVNVNDVAADGTGRVEHEGVVLRDLHGVGGLLVDGTLVNGLGDSVVDELAEKDTVGAGLEEGVTLLSDGDEVLKIGVVLQGVVDPVDEGELLLVGVGVGGAVSGGRGSSTKDIDVAGLLDNGAEAAGLAGPALANNLVHKEKKKGRKKE